MRNETKEEKRIKLTEEYTLVRTSGRFNLEFNALHSSGIRKYKGVHKEFYDKHIGYHGTLYQALKAFLHDYVTRNTNDTADIKYVVEEAMWYIEEAEKKIEKDWKVVKYVRSM